jgi:SPP1 gp7 family putative phage head morphogenesis protein
MNEFKQIQIRHAMSMEGQKQIMLIKINKLINSFNEEILEKIDPDTFNISDTKKEISLLINKMFKKIDKELIKELENLGIYESNFYAFALDNIKEDNYTPLKSSEINKMVLGALFLGGTLRQTLRHQKNVLNKNINKKINIIYNQKLNKNKAKTIIKRNVLRLNNSQNQAIIKTVASNILNSSRLRTFEANGIKKYQYTAILDSNTTKICTKLNKNIYLVSNKNAPRPPQHYGCRSYIVPIIDKSDAFTDSDNFNEFAKTQKDEKLIKDNDSNFKLRNSEVIPLEERIKKDKKIFKN